MIALLYDDPFAGATITSNGVAATMPEENVALQQPTDACRLTDATPWLKFDLGAIQPVQMLGIVYHTGADGVTVRIRGATSDANLTASPLVDETIPLRLAGYGFSRHHALLWLDGPVPLRWWRLDFPAPLDVGGVMGGLPLVLSGPDFGEEWVPATDRRAREVAWTCSFLPEHQVWQECARMERVAGLAEQIERSLGGNSYADQSVKRVLFAQDPGDARYGMDRTMVGFLTGVDGFVVQRTRPQDRRYRKKYVVTEMELP